MSDFTTTTWVDDSAPDLLASQLNRIEAGIKDAAEHHKSGTLAARPAASAANKNWIYNATDASVYLSTGSAWVDLLSNRQPLDSDLTAIAALATTAYGRSLLTLADAAAGRTSLGAAPLASPALTGTPTAPSPPASDDSTRIATTEWARVATAPLDYQQVIGEDPTAILHNGAFTGVQIYGKTPNITPMTLTYTPDEDCLWEVEMVLGHVAKTDANWHWFALEPTITGVLPTVGGNAQPTSLRDIGGQHSAGVQYRSYRVAHVWTLSAGVAYTVAMKISAQGGNWSYAPDPRYLRMWATARRP